MVSFNPSHMWKQLWYQISTSIGLRPYGSDNYLDRKIKSMFGKRGLHCVPTESDGLVFEGIRDGSKSFAAPEVVHLDLTNRCNLDCIACWCHSPLLAEMAMPDDLRNKILPFNVITDLIDDLIQMGGTHQIKLGGGGEPTMHPHFRDILAYIKRKDSNIELDVNTNFTLLDEKLIALMIDLEVDLLTVSLWAGTPTVYARTHPNKTEETFKRLVDRLKALAQLKRNGRPRISIHNVIMNLNYHDVEAMLELALDIGADEITYVLIDPVAGKTEHLLLNHEERLALIKSLKRFRRRMDPYDKYVDPRTGHSIKVTNCIELLRRLSQSATEKGFYDKKAVDMIPCYIGWIYARIMADGSVVPCCKGHRLVMGNLHKLRFNEIWHCAKYSRFRYNGLTLKRSNPYYSVMGNDLTKQTGCYNCDNLMHNLVMHRKILSQTSISKWVGFELYYRICKRL